MQESRNDDDDAPNIVRVTCIGCGTIGTGWALLFALHGHEVTLFDAGAGICESARDRIRILLSGAEFRDAGIDADAVMTRIRIARDFDAAVGQADYVQESIVEDVDIKRALFARLDTATGPRTILASSTSEILGSRFMTELSHPERCLVVHPTNPPYLIPLIELCPTVLTDAATIDRVTRLMFSLARQPICLRREISGFILNRLQMAVLGEALHLVGEGYCGPDDIDRVIKDGLGLRWAFMGPFETGHLNSPGGYLDYVRKFEPLMRAIAGDLRVDYPWNFETIEQIDAQCQRTTPTDAVGSRQAWRDTVIAKLRRALPAMTGEDGGRIQS